MSRSCPICREQRPLRGIRLHGVQVETCDHCQGHWLGERELRQLTPGWKPQAVRNVLQGAPRRCPHARHRVPAGKERCGLCGASAVSCPSCGEHLSQVQTRICALDVCGQCQGLWLDAGELQTLRANRHSVVPLAAGAAAAAALALASASSSLDPQRSRAGQVLTGVVETVESVDLVDVAVAVVEVAPVDAIASGVSTSFEVAAEGASAVSEAVGAVLGSILELFN